MQKHAFDDIRAKGVTRNYNTKTNEKLHGPIKDSYHLRTNFKQVADQILKADHICFASLLIRQYVDEYDGYHTQLAEDSTDLPTPKSSDKPSFPYTLHHSLGSPQKTVSLAELIQGKSSDIAFQGFLSKLTGFLNTFLPKYGIDLPENFVIPTKFQPGEKACFVFFTYKVEVLTKNLFR